MMCNYSNLPKVSGDGLLGFAFACCYFNIYILSLYHDVKMMPAECSVCFSICIVLMVYLLLYCVQRFRK